MHGILGSMFFMFLITTWVMMLDLLCSMCIWLCFMLKVRDIWYDILTWYKYGIELPTMEIYMYMLVLDNKVTLDYENYVIWVVRCSLYTGERLLSKVHICKYIHMYMVWPWWFWMVSKNLFCYGKVVCI